MVATKIQRTALLALFAELAIKGPNATWANDRLVMKAKKLPGLIGETEPQLTPESKATLDEVIGALKDGNDLEVEGKPARKGGGKAKEKGDKPVKEKAAKPAHEVDAFGSRVGTKIAEVNAVILRAKGPLTTEEIMTRAGITEKGKYKQNHLKYLLNEKYVTRGADGKYEKA